jgi:hypothetical protein
MEAMMALRKWLAVMLFAITVAPMPASATAFTTNFSDLWWNPDKSGWGVNIAMQSSVMFATWFVYGADGKAIWYSATLEYSGTTANGALVFAGDLYLTSGPWFGGAFNSAPVQYRKVGTASFTSQYVDSATLQYSVEGVTVIEAIERQTLRNDNMAGSYIGGVSSKAYNCANPANNNVITEDAGYVSVTHSGGFVTVRTSSCVLSGNYAQDGQIGSVGGSFSCSNGESGTITMFEIHTELAGMTGRYTARSQYCSYDANFGGIRRK